MRADCHIHMVLDGVYWKAAIAHQKERVDEALVRQRLEEYRRCGAEYLRDGGDAWGVGLFASQIAQEYGIRSIKTAITAASSGAALTIWCSTAHWSRKQGRRVRTSLRS